MKKLVIQFTCSALNGKYVDLMEFPAAHLTQANIKLNQFKEDIKATSFNANHVKMVCVETIVNEIIDDSKKNYLIFDTIKIILKEFGSIENQLLEQIDINDKINIYLDSLDFVEIIMRIEKNYNISIPDEECAEYITFEDIINGIKKHLN